MSTEGRADFALRLASDHEVLNRLHKRYFVSSGCSAIDTELMQ